MRDFDVTSFDNERECAVCGCAVPVLFAHAGDPVERCASCHNVARYAGGYDPREDY